MEKLGGGGGIDKRDLRVGDDYAEPCLILFDVAVNSLFEMFKTLPCNPNTSSFIITRYLVCPEENIF